MGDAYRVTAPVEGYEGVVGGVRFVDGVAEGELTAAARGYFARRGYTVTRAGKAQASGGTPTGREPGRPGGGPPGQSAAKADWVAYAVTQGVDRDEAEALTKPELIDLTTH